jgi:putative ABC transport system permease protein
LLRPLPYRDPQRLVWVTEIWHKDHDNALVPNPDYTNWDMQAHSFEEMAAYDGGEQSNLTGAGQPERIATVGVTANFFRMLGVEPFLGRAFLPQEALPNGPPLVILSYDLWQRRFGLAPNILQKAVTLDSQRFTVIGVMPPSFQFPDQELKPQLFIPFQLSPRVDWNADWLSDTYVVARLRKNVSREQAAAELQTINERDFAQVSPPFVRMGRRNVQVQVLALQRKLAGDVRPALLMLLGAVGVVLLLACVNVANLQMARTAARQQEFTVRAAIGAGRGRLVRQLFTENAVLAFLGGFMGLSLGVAGVRLLQLLVPPSLAQLGSISLDLTVLAFTIVVTALVSIVSGVLPALAMSKPDINEALKHSGLRVAGAQSGDKLRKLLASAELALALVLLASCGLLLRSFILLSNVDPGFDSHQVLTARLKFPEAKYPKPEQQQGFLKELLYRLKGLPEVESVGLANALPLGGYAGEWAVRFEGEAPLPPGAAPSVPALSVSPDYFRTMRIGLLAGRFFDERDGINNDLPIIINRSFAHRFFPNQDPLGKRVRVGGVTWPWHTVIGVVADVRHVSLDRDADTQFYRPYAAPANDPTATVQALQTITLTVRCKTSPLGLAGALRQQVGKLDPDLPIFDIATMDQRLATELAGPRFNTTLLGVFAGFALLLAIVGI